MKIATKLQRIKVLLKAENIKFITHPNRVSNVGRSDIYIPTYRIAIKGDGEDTQLFFEKHKKNTHPIIIRREESLLFTIEKVKATIIKDMLWQQNKALKDIQRKEKQNNKEYGRYCKKRENDFLRDC